MARRPRSARTMLLLLAIASGSAACAQSSEPAGAASRSGFEAAQIATGAELAAIGNCRTCHTAPGGRPYAGGRALDTPFGTIYSTNVTPDRETGIGEWSAADFARALREGVDREGRHLYPAFPYDHFTLVSDADVDALRAFIMTREPVKATAPPNRLMFPANVRPLLAFWKGLYFRPGRFVADADHDAQWNRGAYLVEGLAHCGACHTPRNLLGAEKRGAWMEGGDAEGWFAPALAAASRAPVRWTAEAMFAYLRRGFDADHGIAAGSMAPVVDNLATAPEADVRAIAAYLTDHGGTAPANSDAGRTARAREFDAVADRTPARAIEANASAPAEDAGETIFAGTCAICHYEGDALPARKPAPLALATSVNAPDPRNALRIVRDGIHPDAGEAGAIMPGFAGALTAPQIAAVVSYMRARFSDQPRWTRVDEALRQLERSEAK